MNKLRICICFLLVLCAFVYADKYQLVFTPTHSSNYFDYRNYVMNKVNGKVPINNNVVANGYYEATFNQTGWGVLGVSTNSALEDKIQAYTGGFFEGYLTGELFQGYWYDFIQYTFDPESDPKLNKFLEDNLRYLNTQIGLYKNNTSTEEGKYWYHISLILDQIQGLYDGYVKGMLDKNLKPTLSLFDIFKFQIDGDIGDLANIFSTPQFHKMSREELISFSIFKNRCSALFRLTNDRKNLIMTHATWDTFSNMLRIYKHYELNFRNVPSKLVSFSSTPGWLVSVDDFYITSSGLTVIETTNNIYNTTLYNLVKPQSVLYWMRNMVANRLSTSAKQWTQLFAKYNSGTYNNQWIVVDIKRFVPGARTLDPELIYILEQIPGYCETASVSSYLEKNGYWASYNVPFFPYIYNVSGYLDQYKKNGNSFSYEYCPRANIFRRDAPSANDVEGVQRLIRKNEFKQDPFSLGDACNQVAARCDLNAPTAPRHRAFGAIDAKVTDIYMAKENIALAQNGPTHDEQPPFTWKEGYNDLHFGQPQTFDFDWVEMSPKL
ncbi:hypothetical protein ABK040_007791 [Willaertia magna]